MESSPLNVRPLDRLRLELRTVARLDGVSESVVAPPRSEPLRVPIQILATGKRAKALEAAGLSE